jgi:hypothetical protein
MADLSINGPCPKEWTLKDSDGNALIKARREQTGFERFLILSEPDRDCKE